MARFGGPYTIVEVLVKNRLHVGQKCDGLKVWKNPDDGTCTFSNLDLSFALKSKAEITYSTVDQNKIRNNSITFIHACVSCNDR